jgi:hypothetical protein
MTADYSSLAVYDLRSFIWNQIVSAGLIDPNDYFVEGMDVNVIPIIPSQQVPEFNNNLPGKTYIIYDYETMPSQETWWMTHEMLNLMIISIKHDQINTILNFLFDLFRRYDNSAKDIFAQNSILSKNFEFKYTAVNSVKAPTPFKNEGGQMVGHIDILYSYVRKLDSSGRFA